MLTFVMVPGAWHAGWCWERVAPRLETEGCRVVTPDLLGTGGGDPGTLASVTLADWADQIAEVVLAQGEPVVLVGHSRGGIVISEVAQRVPDRIRTLVYVTALLLPDGGTVARLLNLSDEQMAAHLLAGADGLSLRKPGSTVARFYNLTAPEWAERADQRLGAEPVRVFTTPLALTADRFGRVPRAYIECTEDLVAPLPLQRAMQAELPCDPVITLPTDHSPFYSAPDELAQALLAIGRAGAHHPEALRGTSGPDR